MGTVKLIWISSFFVADIREELVLSELSRLVVMDAGSFAFAGDGWNGTALLLADWGDA
jgi:hypothetical protein